MDTAWIILIIFLVLIVLFIFWIWKKSRYSRVLNGSRDLPSTFEHDKSFSTGFENDDLNYEYLDNDPDEKKMELSSEEEEDDKFFDANPPHSSEKLRDLSRKVQESIQRSRDKKHMYNKSNKKYNERRENWKNLRDNNIENVKKLESRMKKILKSNG